MILDNTVHLGNEGDQYKIIEKSFEGYDVDQDKLPINSEGVMGIDTIEVVYYYKYRALPTVFMGSRLCFIERRI